MMLRTLSSFRRTSLALACAVSILAAARGSAQSDAALQYQARGDRSEGLRTIAVGGYDVELISARAEPAAGFENRPAPSVWADTVRLRFYQPGDDKVFITVRQLRSRTTYYWLNNVTSRFEPGSVNEYAWPTEPVLRRLKDVQLDDLGATVRVGQEQPAKSERVLPALLSDAPTDDTAAGAYRFQLKTNGRAKVSAAIYAEDKVLYRRPANWEAANSPFTVRWDSSGSPEGWYRLVLTGYFENNTPLDKEILFYHRPSLSR
jgi:hypothetical protein